MAEKRFQRNAPLPRRYLDGAQYEDDDESSNKGEHSAHRAIKRPRRSGADTKSSHCRGPRDNGAADTDESDASSSFSGWDSDEDSVASERLQDQASEQDSDSSSEDGAAAGPAVEESDEECSSSVSCDSDDALSVAAGDTSGEDADEDAGEAADARRAEEEKRKAREHKKELQKEINKKINGLRPTIEYFLFFDIETNLAERSRVSIIQLGAVLIDNTRKKLGEFSK